MKLQLQHISQVFQNDHRQVSALQNINLEVKNGEFVCLVGPSGCGKSTLLNLIAGLSKPTAGQISFSGNLGFMFQEPTLFPWLKAQDNIGFGLSMANTPPPLVKQKVRQYLKMVHLQNFGEAYPHQLSGGMKQRVALARTLILNPDLLLMDEPFANLDAQTREMLYLELQNLWQATRPAIIFVTHNVREAVCLGDRVIVFTSRPGRLKKEFKVTLPRPRDLGNLEVIKISNQIQGVLKAEVLKALKQMERDEKRN